MEKQEFYEQAQKLRKQYNGKRFETELISFIVYEVFKNNEKLPEKIEFEYHVAYWERRGEYREIAEKLVNELGLACEYISCAISQVQIIGPKFK